METEKTMQIAFAAIEKVVENNIPSYQESEARGKDYIQWGEDNKFPTYLYGLYNDVTTLRSIINGTRDFVCGDNIVSNIKYLMEEVNKKGEKLYDFIGDIIADYLIYGNAYIQVVRNKGGQVAELYRLSPRYVRTDKKNDLFLYSEDFDKTYVRSAKKLVYPKFVPEATDIPTSVIAMKTENDKAYGLPLYIASLKECEIQRQLSDFNLSQLENGFFGSFIFNFSNGIPSDEQKAEIERDIQEKFCGSGNAGRFLLNFSDGKENGVTLSKIDIQNFAEKYNVTDTRASKKIYEAFGASSVLFGVEKETTGFNSEDYEQSFKLYNRVRVKPLQKKIENLFDKIYGTMNTLTIEPFKIDWGNNKEEQTEE